MEIKMISIINQISYSSWNTSLTLTQDGVISQELSKSIVAAAKYIMFQVKITLFALVN